MSTWELPRPAWERFLVDGDAAALLAAVRAKPPRARPFDAEYPALHRIRDVELDGVAYRVTRLLDADDGEERLFIEPTDVPDYAHGGVPYWLQGEALRRWVLGEEASPSKDVVDWEAYRNAK